MTQCFVLSRKPSLAKRSKEIIITRPKRRNGWSRASTRSVTDPFPCTRVSVPATKCVRSAEKKAAAHRSHSPKETVFSRTDTCPVESERHTREKIRA